MKCSRCRGKGFVKRKEDKDCIYIKVCSKCKGHKELDWLEQICGCSREEKDIYEFWPQMQAIMKTKPKDVNIYNIDKSEDWLYPYFQFKEEGD